MTQPNYTIEVIESAPFGQNAFVLWHEGRTDAIVFDPAERVNPGKVIPMHACREWTGVTGVRSGEFGMRNSALPIPQSALDS